MPLTKHNVTQERRILRLFSLLQEYLALCCAAPAVNERMADEGQVPLCSHALETESGSHSPVSNLRKLSSAWRSLRHR